ncbi:hypothetical protein WJX72_010183 [[Myrmecia] bisecta]|uniref:Uncharacterized protein n=1 Tax=[Myrmecia] bisecta TaxID=41462 RepID=A0AAW1P667_9CHLO
MDDWCKLLFEHPRLAWRPEVSASISVPEQPARSPIFYSNSSSAIPGPFTDYFLFFPLHRNTNINNIAAAKEAGGDVLDSTYFTKPIDCRYSPAVVAASVGTPGRECERAGLGGGNHAGTAGSTATVPNAATTANACSYSSEGNRDADRGGPYIATIADFPQPSVYIVDATATGGPAVARLEFVENVPLRELKGVWQAVGDQYPMAVYEAFEANKMPDCAASDGTYSYDRLDATAPQFTVIGGTNDNITRIGANLQRTTFAIIGAYNSSLIRTSNARTGVVSCAHWKPFVDLATGEMMAEAITLTRWTTNTTSNTPIRTSLGCEIRGDELPGCYAGAIAMLAYS